MTLSVNGPFKASGGSIAWKLSTQVLSEPNGGGRIFISKYFFSCY